MILELDGACRRVVLVGADHPVACRTDQGGVVLDNNPIEKHRDEGGLDTLADTIEERDLPENIIALPGTRLAGGIDQRGKLSVDRAHGAVGIGGILVVVEHLNLVEPHEKDTRVAASLALTGGWCGRLELQVKLHVAKDGDARDITGTLDDAHRAVHTLPAAGGAIQVAPVLRVRPIEENNRIRRDRVWRDDAGLRAAGIVDTPQAAGQKWGIGIA